MKMRTNLQHAIMSWLTVAILGITVAEGFRSLYRVKDLYNNILANNDIRIRPRTNQSHTVMLSTRFIPNNIIEFDTTEQRFSILGSIEMTWRDDVLSWSSDMYEGTEQIKVPLKEMWKPSLILLKAFDGNGIIGEASNDMATVKSDGTVTWTPECIFSYVCEVDIQYYPFDEQRCTLAYYVSDETKSTVSLTHNKPVLMDHFIENSEWNLVDVNQTWYERYTTYYIEIEFTVQRRANFATFTMIVPLLMLAFLNICVFLVPIDSGEKGGFSITIFLSYGIFVSIVSDTLPHNSLQTSFFVLFLIVLLLFSVLSVFYAIMQAKIYATIGEKECTLNFCNKQRSQIMPEQKLPVEDDTDVEVSSRSTTPVRPASGKVAITSMTDLDQDEDGFPEKNDDIDDDKEPYTWRKFMEQLDSMLFLGFFVLIVIATVVFFCLMMQRLSGDSFKG